jgi:hypothetical protein
MEGYSKASQRISLQAGFLKDLVLSRMRVRGRVQQEIMMPALAVSNGIGSHRRDNAAEGRQVFT